MSELLACPACGVLGLVELCHEAPDPRFICDDCGGTFDAQLKPCEDSQ